MSKILIVFLFVLVFVFSIHTFSSINQDIGRHLTLGKIIWETKEVSKTNLFSYTNPDFPFINHHWFGEVLLYLGSVIFGLKGLIILKAGIITTAFSLAFFAFFKKEHIFSAIIVGLISIFILIERTDVRPEIFSFLFLSWYLFVLFRKSDSKLIWTLPIVQLIWVNTHIYFFLGPLIFILFFFNRILVTSDRLKLILVGLLIFLANFLNPNGLDGALYPLFALNNYGYSIVENQGPFFLKAWEYPWLTTYALFAGVILGAVSFLVNLKNLRKNIFEFSLFIVSVILAFKMIRNYPIFALTLMPISIKNFFEASIIPRTRYNRSSVLIIFLAILIFSVIGNQVYESSNLGRRFGLHIPEGVQKAVDFVRENNLRGPIFNNFDVGSFLIWKLPEEKIFIDGRPEAYPADFIQDVYIPMQENQAIWEKYSKEYGINYVFWLYTDITPWSQKFVRFMLSNPDWPLVYRDGLVMIFVRK